MKTRDLSDSVEAKRQAQEKQTIGWLDNRYGDDLVQEIAEQDELWDLNYMPVTAGSYDLNNPESPYERLTLKANVPSTIMLQGSADLLFGAFAIQITANTLQRNMANKAWGAASPDGPSGTEDGDARSSEYALPGLTAIDLVAARSPKAREMLFVWKEDGSLDRSELTANKHAEGIKTYVYGVKPVAIRTDLLRIENIASDTGWLFLSSSLPSRVGIAIGDDSPVQMFPAEMADGGSVVTRDLAGALNAAWHQAKPQGAIVQIPLKLTSLTDGEVTVAFRGTWGRSWQGTAVPVPLDAVNPGKLAVNWPFKGQSAAVSLRLAGKLSGGISQNLVPAPEADDLPFAVRAGEKLEIAQAVVLDQGPGIAKARQVSAVWLLLPALPNAEQKVELRLAKAVGSPPVPSDDPIARVVAVLPADATAYIKAGGEYWFRAGFDAPVLLDGAQMIQPLFVMAAGRGEGTLLGHQRAVGQGKTGEKDWIPAGVKEAGSALIRNLGRSRTWEAQTFNRQRSHWKMDLELVPLAAEYGSAVSAAIANQPGQARQAGFTGQTAAASIDWMTVAAPADDQLTFQLQSTVAASLTAQVLIYHAVMEQDVAVDTPVKKKK